MVDGWLVFFCIRQKTKFVNGFPNSLLRTAAKFVEPDAHTMGDSFGVSIGACVARAISMCRHCMFGFIFLGLRLLQPFPFDALA